MKRFALTGAAGYIAPRHMKAIKDTGNDLLAVLDPHDSVGIIDRYFPNADYFGEFERFDRHIEKLRQKGPDHRVEYVSICSPNYLHDSHIRFALRIGAHAICEKPLVLNPWNVDALAEIEGHSEGRINTILQLRHHPEVIALKKKIDSEKSQKKWDVDLTYITGRGHWYDFSWKGDASKSGGVGTNIGIHFFDMLLWLFGDLLEMEVHLNENNKCAGILSLQKAHVRWYLSVDVNDLPDEVKLKGQRTFRSIQVEGSEIDLSHGFEDLHTVSYAEILSGKGYGLSDVRPSIELAHQLRHAKASRPQGDAHSFIKKAS